MKRAFTNLITLIFLGFLLIGIIGIFQNIIQDVSKSFNHETKKGHLLAYQEIQI